MAFLPEARLFLTFSQNVPLTHNPPRAQNDPSSPSTPCSRLSLTLLLTPAPPRASGPAVSPPGLPSPLLGSLCFVECCLPLGGIPAVACVALSSGCEDGCGHRAAECVDPGSGRPRRRSPSTVRPATLARSPHLYYQRCICKMEMRPTMKC